MEIHDLQDFIEIDLDFVARAAALAADEDDPSLSISIVDNASIHEVNRKFLDHDHPTDVISFDYGEGEDGDAGDGEVIVSAEKAVEVASALGRDPKNELILYVVHGVLHLRGYDDKGPDQEAAMRQRETEVLQALGLESPWRGEGT